MTAEASFLRSALTEAPLQRCARPGALGRATLKRMNYSVAHAAKVCPGILLVALCFGATAATAPDLHEYINEQFGFVLRYPAALVPGTTRSDGSGQEFHTPNGEFKVFAFAVPAGGNPRQVIARSFANERKMFGDTVSYRRKGGTWFVVSGVSKAGLEFYSKAYANSSAVTLLRITYPHSQNGTYDPWVTLIEKNFTSARKVPSSHR